MAEQKQEQQATAKEEADTTIATSEQDVSQESGTEQNESSDKTVQDVQEEATRQAQSDFDKQTALLDKFSKSPAAPDRLQQLVDDAIAKQNSRQQQTTETQVVTSDSEDDADVMTKADARQLRQDIQGLVSNAIQEPNKRAALADIGSFLDASMEAGSITEKDRNRVESIMYLFSPEGQKIRPGWDEASNIAREFLQGKAALNIISKMKVNDISIAQKKQTAMKDTAQPDSASTPQTAKEKDSPEDKTLAEFRTFHEKKSIFAKQ